MDERTRPWVMVGISGVVLFAIVLFIALIEGFSLWSLVMLVAVVALGVVALIMAARSLSELRSGFPLKDERTVSMNMRAGNRAFQISMYLFLVLGGILVLLEDEGMEFSNAEIVFILVAVMGSVHIVLMTYYNRRGRGSSE